LGPLDTWLYQSPPEWGVSGWTRGCTGALLSGESPIAAGDVVTPEPSRALEWGKSYLIRGSSGALPSQGGQVLEPWDTWRYAAARLVSGPGLEHACGVPGLQGTDSGPRTHLGRGREPTSGANISFSPHIFSVFRQLER
jgi:hypothetical protein